MLAIINIDGETYLNASEAAKYLGIARDTFYRNVRGQLTPHRPGMYRRDLYRKSELDKMKQPEKLGA